MNENSRRSMNENNRGGNRQAIDAQPFSAESQFAHVFSCRLRVLLTDRGLPFLRSHTHGVY
jgi:hypothetical protein